MVVIARQCDIKSLRPEIVRFCGKLSSPLGGDDPEFFIDSIRQRVSRTQ
jgi:hypothetical protein